MPFITGRCGVCVFHPEYGDCTCCGCPPRSRRADGECVNHPDR